MSFSLCNKNLFQIQWSSVHFRWSSFPNGLAAILQWIKNHSFLLIPNPQSKYNYILSYKYNAITNVAYYNSQSILVRLPINKRCFQLGDFRLEMPSAWLRAMLQISCNIGTCDLLDMYTLSPWALGIGHTYQNTVRLAFFGKLYFS